MKKKFESVAMTPENPKWKKAIKRNKELYSRNNEFRTDFEFISKVSMREIISKTKRINSTKT